MQDENIKYSINYQDSAELKYFTAKFSLPYLVTRLIWGLIGNDTLSTD